MNQINLSSQKTWLLLVSFLLAASCSNRRSGSVSWQSGIQEPFENITIGCNGNEVDAEGGGEIFYASGTKIYIPPNAFVDEEGNPVKGAVTIQYREFHSATEIMVSGIPMKYNNNGNREDFESAGMFEIKAEASGKQLRLAPGKSIDMWLASDKEEDNFNFYRFDQEQNEWVEVSTGSQNVTADTSNRPATDLEETVQKMIQQPVVPQMMNESQPVFELVINASENVGEVDDLGIKLWQLENFGSATADEIAVLSNPEKWDKHSLRVQDADKGTYELRVDKGENRYRYIIKPVLFGPELRKARGEYARAEQEYNTNYRRMMDSMELAYKATDTKMAFVRAVSVNQMGIYNCDRYLNVKNDIIVQATFKLQDGSPLDLSAGFYNIVTTRSGSQILVNVSPGYVRFSFSENNTFVAVLPGDRLAVVTNEDIQRMDKRAMKKTGQASFVFKKLEKNVNSIKDLDQLLASI